MGGLSEGEGTPRAGGRGRSRYVPSGLVEVVRRYLQHGEAAEAVLEAKLTALIEAEQALQAARDTLPPLPGRAELEKLAADPPALWNAPATSPGPAGESGGTGVPPGLLRVPARPVGAGRGGGMPETPHHPASRALRPLGVGALFLVDRMTGAV